MSKKSTSKTDNGPSAFSKPYVTSAINGLQGTVNQNAGSLQGISSELQGHATQLGQQAFGDNPNLDAANSYNQSVLGGHYLDQGNPYLNQMIDQTNNDVADQVNSRFGMSGATGGIQNQQMMTREMLNAENGLRYGNYNQERTNMATAAGQAPQLASAQYAGVMPYLATSEAGASTPYLGSQLLASGTAGLMNPYTSGTTTQTQGPGAGLAGILGAGLAGWASGGFKSVSDPRAKRDVQKLGELDDGLGVYRFRYKDGHGLPEGEHVGVMADEVAQLRPWAIGPIIGGFASVDYGRL